MDDGDEGDDGDQGDELAEQRAAVLVADQVGVGVVVEDLAELPHDRADEEHADVPEDEVRGQVGRRDTAEDGEPGHAEEGETGEDGTGLEEERGEAAHASVADGPAGVGVE